MLPKFRAWHKELKILRSVFLLNGLNTGSSNEILVMLRGIKEEYEPPVIMCYFDQIELMQWTGHVDKNNKEIYVGDIVKCNHLAGMDYYTCILDNLENALIDIHNGKIFPLISEVLGNIYENPEFLK